MLLFLRTVPLLPSYLGEGVLLNKKRRRKVLLKKEEEEKKHLLNDEVYVTC